ncbi:MAG TPA: hypothetical protein VG735_06080 [Caulobacterales bacterium]|nr:hypothetical protein [Caulobacterales bacterium]
MTDAKTVEGHVANPPSPKKLLLITGGGFLAAIVIAVLFVLPVEYQIDLTGFGRASGLSKLAGPKVMAVENTAAAGAAGAQFYPTPYRNDVIEIPLASADVDPSKSELEYKVRMKTGDSFVYSWTVTGLKNPEEFYYDFHGEQPAGPENPEAKVVEFKQATGMDSNGTLVAHIPGVHGWYLQNQSVGPVVVHLKLSGFYELVPPGEYGNAAGISPKQ